MSMAMPKNDNNISTSIVILVPLDGSELARAAISAARAVLSRVPGRIILFHAVWPGMPEDQVDRPIEAELQALRDLGLDATVERRPTPRDEETGQVVATVARELGVDLIVMTTHGRGGLGRLLFGSVKEQVVACSDVPVMITPSELAADWPGVGRASVLVALNGSDSAERAIKPAAKLARALKAEIILARILPDGEDHGNQNGRRPDEAKSYLLSVSSALRCQELPTRTIVRRGEPARAIEALAQERNVSAIAVGAPRGAGSGRCALGKVAMGIIRRSNVPVVVGLDERISR
jgi:nucleotide-binding universal stress UspA family protein